MLLLVHYQTKPSARDAFLRAAAPLAETIRREDGCISYEYYLDAAKPDAVLLVEEWQTPEHQQRHMAMPHMAELKRLKEQLVCATAVRRV